MIRRVRIWVEATVVPLYYYSGVTKVKWTKHWLEITYNGGHAKVMIKTILAFQDDFIETGR